MTTRLIPHETTAFSFRRAVVVPCLGEAWAHVPAHRLVLSYAGGAADQEDPATSPGVRYGTLIKSTSRTDRLLAPFRIDNRGIRDLPVHTRDDTHHA